MANSLHNLKDEWKFYYKGKSTYRRNQSEKDWLSGFNTVSTCKTVEMFWRIFNNIPDWLELPFGTSYAFFKNDITASWEHPENIEGASIVLYLNRHCSIFDTHPDLYLNFLLLLVGAKSFNHTTINGVSFERKYKSDKIVVWMSESTSFEKKDGCLTSPTCNLLTKFLHQIDLEPKHFEILTDFDNLADIKYKETPMLVRTVNHRQELEKNEQTFRK